MKNLALAFAFILSFAGATQAETRPAKENSVTVARHLYNVLRLNEGQYIKIKSLDKVRVQEQKDASSILSGESLARELEEIETRFNTSVQALLSTSQLEAYQLYQNK